MQLPASVSSAIGFCLLLQIVQSAPNDGKYNPRKYNRNGKYVHRGEGDYVEDLSRYKYVHYDDGDRGRYFHIHIPYDGGYGNYEGGHEPYRFPPYDPTGEYAELISKYSQDPFRNNVYDIKKPSIHLEYGVPYLSETNTASSDVRKSLLPGPGTAYLPVAESDLDVRKSLLPGLGTGYLPVLAPEEQGSATGSSERNSKFTPYHTSGEDNHLSLTTASGANSAELRATEEPRSTPASSKEDDKPHTTTDSPPTDDSLHNHPCFATSGPLKLSKA
ncbi:uncharacterized protein LOC125952400 isoform X1 [Anopheles darlingi]|uniref:uncharacterized protein LOC125952400 isoform X1 n=1 Tax=Anopheles darlingi TaxID=43151 RepID=UPI00210019DA|nr:uncharacterized protein LOC125952400 isoform X1 [Anopheles darlingi]